MTPEQARVFAAVVRAAGGDSLDLSIPAYPSEVRWGSGVFFVSGNRAADEAHRERFERIGRASDADDAPAAAFISEMAVLLAYLPMAVGLLQGVRSCEHHDLPLEWFKDTVLELYPSQISRCSTGLPGTRTRRASEAGDGDADWTWVAAHTATR